LQALEDEAPDLVHCEWTNLAPFLQQVRRAPRVITAHNVESDIWRRLAQNSTNPLKSLVGRQQAKRIEALEREWYPRVDRCIAVSEEDGYVISSYGAKVAVVENGVDINYYDYTPAKVEESRLSFVASFDVFTNQDAVHFFVNEIFPLIKKAQPSATFWIVGKEPPESIRNYSSLDRAIHVTGTVPDIREPLSGSAICVVPLRIGGGSRLKILEAMAMRKPVVSTSVGAEGLRVTNGSDILIADEPGDFAQKVCALMADKSRQKSLAESGWHLVKSHYDWEILIEKQDAVWRDVVHSRG
jgi:glycosyltransferase involved in cell wall biosynthesis